MTPIIVTLLFTISAFGVDLEPLNLETGDGSSLPLSGYITHSDFNAALSNMIGVKLRNAIQETLINNKQKVAEVDHLLSRMDQMEYTFLQIFHSLAAGDITFTNQLIQLYTSFGRLLKLSDYFKEHVTFLTQPGYDSLNSIVNLTRRCLKSVPEDIINSILSLTNIPSVFELAAVQGNVGVIKLLKSHINATQRTSALETAWRSKRYDVVKTIIRSNETLEIPESIINNTDSKGESVLFLAAELKNPQFVENLLKIGTEVNIFSKSGETPLHRAVKNNNIVITKLLIEKGANVNVADDSGRIPLHEAVMNGNHDIVTLLLSLGSSVDKETNEGLTPLMISEKYVLKESMDYLFWNKIISIKKLQKDLKFLYLMTSYEGINRATKRRKIDLDRILEYSIIAKELLLRGEKTNIPNDIKSKLWHLVLNLGIKTLAQSMLNIGAKLDTIEKETKNIFRKAVANDNHEITALMLNEGMPVDTEFNGVTALQVAADHGSVTTFNLLLEKGADINKVKKYIGSMLHAACEGGKETIVRYLLDKGYKVDLSDKDRNTPLFYAAIFGHSDIVKLLLDHKADVSARNKDNETALHFATYSNDAKTINALIEKGAEIDVSNKNGETPLFQAANNGYSIPIEIFIKAGATIDVRDNDNRTPLEVSVLKGSINSTRVLLDNGMNPNIISSRSDPILHLAISNGKLDQAELLIKKGALVNTPNSKGQNALHLAVNKNSLKMVQLLVASGISINAKDKDGRTPLDYAINKCYRDIVVYLVKGGAKGSILVNPKCPIA